MSTKQDYNSTNSDVGDGLNSTLFGATRYAAQTFQGNNYYRISSVKLCLYRQQTGNLTVSIRKAVGNLPTGSDLCSGITNGTTLTTNAAGEWREITFSSSYLLNPNTQYAIVISGGPTVNAFGWCTQISGSYARGRRCESTDSGVTWSASIQDSLFETWGKSAGGKNILWGRNTGWRF